MLYVHPPVTNTFIRWHIPEGHTVLGAVVCTRIDAAAHFSHRLQPDHRWRVKVDAPACRQNGL